MCIRCVHMAQDSTHLLLDKITGNFMNTLHSNRVLGSQCRYHVGGETSMNLDGLCVGLNSRSASAVRSRNGEDCWRRHCRDEGNRSCLCLLTSLLSIGCSVLRYVALLVHRMSSRSMSHFTDDIKTALREVVHRSIETFPTDGMHRS